MKQRIISALLIICVLLCIALALINSHPGFLIFEHRHDLSIGVQNIVKRAYQMTDIQWTPKLDIVSWNGDLIYEAGTTYTGLPYGRPVNASFVPWDTDLNGFLEAVNDPYSLMYTARSDTERDAPYYSIDCSAFVTWAWQLDERRITKYIPDVSEMISDTNYEEMQVGDCLCKPGVHTVLVTDILYDKNEHISSVELSESTVKVKFNDCCIRTWYGAGHPNSLEDMNTKYFENGYAIYRLPGRDNVTYTHSCASPLPGDVCTICGYGLDNSDQ